MKLKIKKQYAAVLIVKGKKDETDVRWANIILYEYVSRYVLFKFLNQAKTGANSTRKHKLPLFNFHALVVAKGQGFT